MIIICTSQIYEKDGAPSIKFTTKFCGSRNLAENYEVLWVRVVLVYRKKVILGTQLLQNVQSDDITSQCDARRHLDGTHVLHEGEL